MRIEISGVKFDVLNTKVECGAENCCTATGTVNGEVVSVKYSGAVYAEYGGKLSAKPWLRQARLDLVRKYIESGKMRKVADTEMSAEKLIVFVDTTFRDRLEKTGLRILFEYDGGFNVAAPMGFRREPMSLGRFYYGKTPQVTAVNEIKKNMEALKLLSTETEKINELFGKIESA